MRLHMQLRIPASSSFAPTASSCAAVRHKILASEKGEEPRPEVPPPDTSNGHVLIVHRLHVADAEDAWIQREWGEIQAAQGNLQQAATHLEVPPAMQLCGKLVISMLGRRLVRRWGIGVHLLKTAMRAESVEGDGAPGQQKPRNGH